MDDRDRQLIERAAAFARERLSDLHPSHGWDHVLRVIRNAEHIAESIPKADLFIVTLAAVLHDIARRNESESNGNSCHAEEGSAVACEFLISEGLDGARARHVSECVRTHRFRGSGAPATIEAEIVYDADKLDSIGAVGIGRAFLFAGEVGAKLHNPDTDLSKTRPYTEEDTAYREFYVKLSRIKDKMLTARGKEIALERHRFMEIFFDKLNREFYGEE